MPVTQYAVRESNETASQPRGDGKKSGCGADCDSEHGVLRLRFCFADREAKSSLGMTRQNDLGEDLRDDEPGGRARGGRGGGGRGGIRVL